MGKGSHTQFVTESDIYALDAADQQAPNPK
jgi:hypothetical protein